MPTSLWNSLFLTAFPILIARWNQPSCLSPFGQPGSPAESYKSLHNESTLNPWCVTSVATSRLLKFTSFILCYLLGALLIGAIASLRHSRKSCSAFRLLNHSRWSHILPCLEDWDHPSHPLGRPSLQQTEHKTNRVLCGTFLELNGKDVRNPISFKVK